MKPMKLALVAALMLAGCGSSNPFGGGGGGVTPDPDPGDKLAAQLAGSLGSAQFVGGNLEITLVPFDTPAVTYVRTPSLDISGYQAYVPVANDTINRNFIAYVARINGAVAIAVGDGGRNVDAFGGVGTNRTGIFNAPATGLATYRGGYAGLRVIGDGSVAAQTPDRVTGNVEVSADFTDDSVEGSISNRVNIDDPTEILTDRFLKVTEIKETGNFSGVIATGSDLPNGSYSGVFSNGGRSVAGVVAIDVGDKEGFQDDVTEYGVFAIPCVLGDPASTVCN